MVEKPGLFENRLEFGDFLVIQLYIVSISGLGAPPKRDSIDLAMNTWGFKVIYR